MGGLISMPIKRASHKPIRQFNMLRLMIFTELLVDDGEKIIFVLGFNKFTDKITTLVEVCGDDIKMTYGVADASFGKKTCN